MLHLFLLSSTFSCYLLPAAQTATWASARLIINFLFSVYVCVCVISGKKQGMLLSHLSPCLSVSEGDRRMWASGSVSSAPRLWWALFLSLWASMQLCLVLSSLTPDHLAPRLYLPRLPLLPKPPPALANSYKPPILRQYTSRLISQIHPSETCHLKCNSVVFEIQH